jgi:hypothetical protein
MNGWPRLTPRNGRLALRRFPARNTPEFRAGSTGRAPLRETPGIRPRGTSDNSTPCRVDALRGKLEDFSGNPPGGIPIVRGDVWACRERDSPGHGMSKRRCRQTAPWGSSPIRAESYGKGPCGCQSGITTSTRRAELAGQPEILRKVMAHMSQCAQCSPTSRRILRNEPGSDPGGQHGAQYRVQMLSRG